MDMFPTGCSTLCNIYPLIVKVIVSAYDKHRDRSLRFWRRGGYRKELSILLHQILITSARKTIVEILNIIKWLAWNVQCQNYNSVNAWQSNELKASEHFLLTWDVVWKQHFLYNRNNYFVTNTIYTCANCRTETGK